MAYIDDNDEYDPLSLAPAPTHCTIWYGSVLCNGLVGEVRQRGLILTKCRDCGVSYGSRPYTPTKEGA